MKHAIIGILGEDDRPNIDLEDDVTVTYFDFFKTKGKFGHRIGQTLSDLSDLGIPPSDAGLDLFLLATLVYAADTRISRKSESQDNWTRELYLRLPVAEPDKWNACRDKLSDLLSFLTGDLWDVGFRLRTEEFLSLPEVDPTKRRPTGFTTLSLLSGGMDSLIGAINQLEQGEYPLFVSHVGDGATSKAQAELLQGLANEFGEDSFRHLRVWLQVRNGLVQDVKSENTTRSRSFLFISAAMMAGSGLDANFTLSVPENGLIALNVPLDTTRVGALSTRTTHPYYFARWQELLSGIGIPGRIDNPFWNQTKGEMMEQCQNQASLKTLLSSSLSCSSPSKGRWLGLGTMHCGYCLPCIIRRAAILHGLKGAVPDPTRYIENYATKLNTKKAKGKQVRSFQFAISRLQAHPDIAKCLILKTGPLSDVRSQQGELADVYLRGMLEVGRLLENVKTGPG